jgi:glycerophosphoryl diester phosphodiesterase
MKTTRRSFVSMAALAAPAMYMGETLSADAAASKKYQLIAHRGGIVDGQHAENSPGSVKTAIEQGYWMLEVDIRRTKDGEPILQHDGNFQRFYDDPRSVEDVTWKEASALRSKPGNTSPIHFRDLCAMCKNKTRLMLDIKSENYPDDFYMSMKQALSENGLLETTYLLGGGTKAKSFLGTPVYLSCTRKSLAAALERGEDVSHMYLFELASDLTEESVSLSKKAGITSVAAINTFRYKMAKRDDMEGAAEDAERMKKLGITHFQIDSIYEKFFR